MGKPSRAMLSKRRGWIQVEKSTHLAFRRIHLDFHTHEAITGVGEEFDALEFARTLKEASVNSITCFARCHHGWLYYDSKAFPEKVHPHLKNRNLLKEQVEACHKLGISVPIYITVQWDMVTVEEHPEWRVITGDGCYMGTPPYEAGFYRHLCVGTPYRDYLKGVTKEVLETLPTDGVFFDIVVARDCSCRYCRKAMIAQGMEPSDPEQRRAYGVQLINEFVKDMTAFVRKYNKDCTIYYNNGSVRPNNRDGIDAFTHFEFDVLPSTGVGGYMHFPALVPYFRNLGKDCVGQTGRFHTAWGDFHSLKNKAALEYECFQLLALGAKCMIGDQLLPSGRISQAAYNLIGSVYSQVATKEPWCAHAKAVVDIAVLHPGEFEPGTDSLYGAIRMLTEGGHQFDIIDSSMDFGCYKVLVLPDHIVMSPMLLDKIRDYLNHGGALIASFESGMDQQKERFVLSEMGVSLQGNGPIHSDGRLARGRYFSRHDYASYILPTDKLGRGLERTEYVMYIRGMEISATPDVEILGDTISSCFDRSYKHFISHRQAPPSGKVAHPAVVKRSNVVYFSHPIFAEFDITGSEWSKALFMNALELLLPEPLLRHRGPTSMLATLMNQDAENRFIVHLLHYIPERRCANMDVIKDVIPLYDVEVSVLVPRTVREVYMEPQHEKIEFSQSNGRLEIVVPQVVGHQMVVLSF
jgi:hypothetical protein